MIYIFCGYLYPDIENDIKKTKSPMPVSGHKFQMNLINGIMENKRKLYVVNIPSMRHYPNYKKILFHRTKISIKGIKGIHLGFINLPVINYITRYYTLKNELQRIIKKNPNEEFVVMSFGTYLPIDLAMLKIRKKFKKVKIFVEIGDLAGDKGAQTEKINIKNRIVQFLKKYEENLIKRFDYFGVMTEYMADALEIKNKPFVIIEGIYSETCKRNNDIVSIETSKKIIFYAGSVTRQYGILHLLNAFSMIHGNEYNLYIAGNGDAVEDVERFAHKDNRIKYLGYLTPSEVDKYMNNAMVLINPRTSEHDYVKYSFPSKNMECLASGKPYIAHRLICNPTEYEKYILYPADESDIALAEMIIKVCNMNDDERMKLAKYGKNFILSQKNPKIQCKKIIDMIESSDNE